MNGLESEARDFRTLRCMTRFQLPRPRAAIDTSTDDGQLLLPADLRDRDTWLREVAIEVTAASRSEPDPYLARCIGSGCWKILITFTGSRPCMTG